MLDYNKYLKMMIDKGGSDLFFSAHAPVSCKIHGKLVPFTEEILQPAEVAEIANHVMNETQRQDFAKKPEMNLAISFESVGRFRVNIFKQQHKVAMVIRAITCDVPKFEDLNLPPILAQVVMQKRGLILFVGGTGSGKSTSLASLIDYRNMNSAGHIITIEDPVEFVHKHKKSIVNQREVGTDTDSYEDALENTLRQAPDVILIGEIRTAKTMEHALAFAETGHLCISTLHANNASQAIDRIINFFPEERHKQLLLDLSLNMRAIISQRLIPTLNKKRAAAVEVLLGTPRVCDLIKNGQISDIKELMTKSAAQGMQTFDAALYALYSSGQISLDEALNNADSKNNLRLRITLDEKDQATEKPDEPKKKPGVTSMIKNTLNKKSAAAENQPNSSQSIAQTQELKLEPLKEDDDEET